MSNSEQISVKRIIEPFVYFPTHASAIKGLGGANRSPDPNYCFHTHYFEYRPGEVIIHVTLTRARATAGELSIRIHGYRPQHPELGIKLIAAERADLSRSVSGDHVILVHFHAIPGVHYAAYGFFSESSDLTAESVDIVAEERGGDDLENYLEGAAPPTLLDAANLSGVNALISNHRATLEYPTSQACTPSQLHSSLMQDAVPGLTAANELEQWKSVFAARALQIYGLLQSGATGLIIGDAPEPLVRHLKSNRCLIDFVREESDETVAPLLPKSLGHFDFILCLNSSAFTRRYGGMTPLIDKIIQRLLSGGWAIILCDLNPSSYPEAGDGLPPTVSEVTVDNMKQWALRLIGHGCSVAQLNFPSAGDVFEARDSVPFGLIIQR